ncbi:MAG TPA: T9SS type A sorting domain-containing protein [Ferruginibacter sp.]|nr:T9SS type A sorting domain-containing protein [Ferruginibacter sp.]
MKYIFSIILAGSFLFGQAQSTGVFVPTRLQTQSNWCWAACTEMISDGYGRNISQCQAVQDAKNKLLNCVNNGLPVTSTAACTAPGSNNYVNVVVGCRGSCSDLLTNNYGVRSSSFVSSFINLTDFRNDVWGWLVGDRPFIAGGWFGGGGLLQGHAIVIEYYNKSTNTLGFDDPAKGYTSATTNWVYSNILVAAVPDNAKPGGRMAVDAIPSTATMGLAPNPVQRQQPFLIDGLQLNVVYRISILNSNGTVVRRLQQVATKRNLTLSTEGLPSGTYFVQVVQSNETRNLRLVIQ